jgi:D-aminopeptidase
LRDFSRWPSLVFLVLATMAGVSLAAAAAGELSQKPRARDLGVPFDGTPGPFNAITDVAGVTVGHTTLISGSGKLRVGHGPVRTGVTAVLPRGHDSVSNPVFAAWFSQNGNGEMTGTAWVEESGFPTPTAWAWYATR